MSDWYLDTDPADPSKILAILEMAMELQVLPAILMANNFPFIIELACWAAKRDFLKLDKWFADKIRDYKASMCSDWLITATCYLPGVSCWVELGFST